MGATILNGEPRSSSVSKDVLKSGIFNASGWLVTVLLSILSTPYFVYKMSLEGYGLYVLLTGLIGYYSLLDLGLGQAVIKFVSEHSARGEEPDMHRTINAALAVQMWIGIPVALFVTIFASPILGLLNVSDRFFADGQIGLYACSFGFVFTIITGTFSSVLMGFQRYDITGKVNMISNSLLTISIVISLWLGYGVLEAILLSVTFAIVTGLTFFLFVRRLVKGWKFSFMINLAEMRKMFSFSGYMFLSQVSNLFSNYIVRVVISVLLGPSAVTLYVIPMKLINAAGGLLSSSFSVLFPFTSALGAVKDKARIRRGYVESSRLFASFSIPVFLMMFVFARPILTLWMGDSFSQEAWLLLRILSISAILGSLTTVPNTMTLGLGHSRIVGLFSLGTLAVMLVLIPAFTAKWQLLGTVIGMLLSTVPGLFLIYRETRSVFEMSYVEYIRGSLGVHMIPFAILISLGLLELLPIRTFNSMHNVILCCAIGAAYFAVLVVMDWMPLRSYISRLLR